MDANVAKETARKTLEAGLGGAIPKSHRDPVERLAVALSKCHEEVVIAALSTGWGVTRALAVTKSQLHVATARKDEVRIIDLEGIAGIRTRLGDLKLVTRGPEITLGSFAPDGRNYEVASAIRSLKNGENIRAVSLESLETADREVRLKLDSPVTKGHQAALRRLAWLLASRRSPPRLVGLADISTAFAVTDSLVCVVPERAEPQVFRFEQISDVVYDHRWRGHEVKIGRAHDSSLVIRSIEPAGRAREFVGILRERTTDPLLREARQSLYETLCKAIEIRESEAQIREKEARIREKEAAVALREARHSLYETLCKAIEIRESEAQIREKQAAVALREARRSLATSAPPPERPVQSRPVSTVHSATKRCPQCAEDVKADAKVCRYCGYEWLKWWQQSKEQKSRHPASCCGCSCGTVIASITVAVAMMVALSSLSLVPAFGVGLSASLAAVNALNFALGGRPRSLRGQSRL